MPPEEAAVCEMKVALSAILNRKVAVRSAFVGYTIEDFVKELVRTGMEASDIAGALAAELVLK